MRAIFGGTVKCFQPKHRPLKSLARILIRTDTRALFSDVIKKGIIQCEQHDAASDRGRVDSYHILSRLIVFCVFFFF